MSKPSILAMVESWLKTNGYDGLYNEDTECACLLADLAPCGSCVCECLAGVKSGPEDNWRLGPKEPGEE